MISEEQRADLLARRDETAAVVLPDGSLQIVAAGELSQVRVTPAAVLRPVLLAGATSYDLLHTHPRGGGPSQADLAVTRRLVAAGAVLGLQMTRHLVLAPEGTWDCLAPEDRAGRVCAGQAAP